MIQLTYRNTNLTPDDVNDAYENGKLADFCKGPVAHEKSRQVMLYPMQYPEAKVEIQRYVANIWCLDFDQSDRIEKMLNEIFGCSSNPTPFRKGKLNRRISGVPKDEILNTPLGLIAKFAYEHPDIIVEAVKQAMDLCHNWG